MNHTHMALMTSVPAVQGLAATGCYTASIRGECTEGSFELSWAQ
jgi:hypothetical protein